MALSERRGPAVPAKVTPRPQQSVLLLLGEGGGGTEQMGGRGRCHVVTAWCGGRPLRRQVDGCLGWGGSAGEAAVSGGVLQFTGMMSNLE